MDTDRPEGEAGPPIEPRSGDGHGNAPAGGAAEPTDASAADRRHEQLLAGLSRIERLLGEVVEQQQQVQREQQVREFSLADVFASLTQVVAIAAMLGAVLAMLQSPPDRGLAALALLGAIAVQGLSLTLFMLRRK